MKVAKHILFVAGMIGVIAFFLPVIAVGTGVARVEVSARELSFGLSRTHGLIDKDIPGYLTGRVPHDVLSARDDVRTVLHASRGAAVAFIPAVLMLLIAVRAMWIGRLARGLAIAAVVCGLASVGAFLGLRYGIDYGNDQDDLVRRAQLTMELGAHLLIIAGIAGVAGGVLGVVRRELGAPAR